MTDKTTKADKAAAATKPVTTGTTREGNVVITTLPNGLTIRNAVGSK